MDSILLVSNWKGAYDRVILYHIFFLLFVHKSYQASYKKCFLRLANGRLSKKLIIFFFSDDTLYFMEAMNHLGTTLQRILMDYKAASGQIVNY